MNSCLEIQQMAYSDIDFGSLPLSEAGIAPRTSSLNRNGEITVVPEGQRAKFALHLLESFVVYCPELAHILTQAFPVLRFDEDQYPNLMPQVVTGEAQHVLMVGLLNGDNWVKVVADLILSAQLTQERANGEPNVDRLGLLDVFRDSRGDAASNKSAPNSDGQDLLQVKGEGRFEQSIIELLAHVVKLDYLIRLDGHSAISARQAEEAGIEVINLTLAFEMLADLQEKGYFNDDLEKCSLWS